VWTVLKRKRSPVVPVELIAVADNGHGDRRALSLAFAVCDAMRRRRSATVFRVGVEDWIAKDTAQDLETVNQHVYSTIKAANALVLGDVPLKPAPRPQRRSWALLGSSSWLK
jgi:hypothetical protein